MAFNVLIVDDSMTMRSVIRKVISISGFDVGNFFEAGDGKEALEILNEQWIDLVLSDINMPEMDGLTFLKKMREHEVYKNIPVVMITTEGSRACIDEAMSLGVKGYIQKPFRPEVIKEKLEEIMEKTR
jgi:two-component system chemotaxis response regulator CheY